MPHGGFLGEVSHIAVYFVASCMPQVHNTVMHTVNLPPKGPTCDLAVLHVFIGQCNIFANDSALQILVQGQPAFATISHSPSCLATFQISCQLVDYASNKLQ